MEAVYVEVMENKSQLQLVLCDCTTSFQKVYGHAIMVTKDHASKARVSNSEIAMPRVCGQQTLCQNYNASTPEMGPSVLVIFDRSEDSWTICMK